MFFMFLILLLTIYVSETNNFILKRDGLRGSYNVYQNSKDLIFQDDRNVLPSLPTPKSIIPKTHEFINRIKAKPALNKFDKNEPEEVLVKRHIQSNDLPYTSPFFKNTKSTSASTLELKRKLPVAEFTSDSDNINEYLQYFDELEKKPFPFHPDIENAPTSKNTPQILENYNHSKHAKNRVFDLRSLPSKNCQNCDQCVCPNMQKTRKVPQIGNVHDCTRKPELISTMNFYPPYDMFNIQTNNPLNTQLPAVRQVSPGPKNVNINFPMGIGVPMGIPFGMPPGYAGGIPVGVPANVPIAFAPQSYCQENHFKGATQNKPCRNNDHLYYNDDDEFGKIYGDNKDDCNKKKRKHKGELFVNIEYDVEESKKPIQAMEIFNDLNKSCVDTPIKKCYCCSSSSLDTNNVKFRSVLSIWVIMVCQVGTLRLY